MLRTCAQRTNAVSRSAGNEVGAAQEHNAAARPSVHTGAVRVVDNHVYLEKRLHTHYVYELPPAPEAAQRARRPRRHRPPARSRPRLDIDTRTQCTMGPQGHTVQRDVGLRSAGRGTMGLEGCVGGGSGLRFMHAQI